MDALPTQTTSILCAPTHTLKLLCICFYRHSCVPWTTCFWMIKKVLKQESVSQFGVGVRPLRAGIQPPASSTAAAAADSLTACEAPWTNCKEAPVCPGSFVRRDRPTKAERTKNRLRPVRDDLVIRPVNGWRGAACCTLEGTCVLMCCSDLCNPTRESMKRSDALLLKTERCVFNDSCPSDWNYWDI